MSDRFSEWNRRARTCYRAAAFLDNAKSSLQAAHVNVREELGEAPGKGLLEEARRALIEAECAIFTAREKLAAALKEKTLTAESRAPEFWKAGGQ